MEEARFWKTTTQFAFVVRKNKSLHAGSEMQYTQKLTENGLKT